MSTSIGQQDPEHVAGIHLTPPLAPPDPATFDDLTQPERAAIAALDHAEEWESGYSAEQSTRPQTIGYGLVDSPVSLCAWIVEKFWAWTDCDGRPENVLTRDELLDSVMLYWLPGTGASSARLYWESIRQVNKWISGPTSDTVAVPTGCSIFPKELQRPSRRWAAKRFLDIRYWNELPKGGPGTSRPASTTCTPTCTGCLTLSRVSTSSITRDNTPSPHRPMADGPHGEGRSALPAKGPEWPMSVTAHGVAPPGGGAGRRLQQGW